MKNSVLLMKVNSLTSEVYAEPNRISKPALCVSVEVKIIRPETDNLLVGKEHFVRDVEHFPYNYDNLG
jgi:hypothetical protein